MRRFLQLGTYTGDASIWMLDKILTSETSILVDVDTWEGSEEDAHEKIDFEKVFKYYTKRIKKYPNVIWHRKKTMDFLRRDRFEYDFIYIDADHTAIGVLLDAELSWDLLKSGGIMAFDDYEWDQGKGPALNPKSGINAFLHRHKDELDIIEKNWQVWITKKIKPPYRTR